MAQISMLALLLTILLAQVPSINRAATQQTPATTSEPRPSRVGITENVLYGSVAGAKLHLDIFEPAPRFNKALPAIVLIHGGAWTSLDKGTMRGMGEFFARSGLVAFSVDYRLLQGSENRWPAQLDDVQRAVRWVRANAATYGVNPEHIGAFGHSAGAQLAALLGMEGTRDNSDRVLAKFSSRVQAVVDVSGPTDFTAYEDPGPAAFFGSLFGTDFLASPQVWRDASPAFHVSKTVAPFLIVHGTHDQDVPISQAQELFKKLKSAGVPVSFIQVNDAHTFQTLEARHELAVESLAFFRHYLFVSE